MTKHHKQHAEQADAHDAAAVHKYAPETVRSVAAKAGVAIHEVTHAHLAEHTAGPDDIADDA